MYMRIIFLEIKTPPTSHDVWMHVRDLPLRIKNIKMLHFGTIQSTGSSPKSNYIYPWLLQKRKL